MTNWNPNSGMLGPEFLASRISAQTLSRSSGFVQRFRATSTQTINTAHLYGSWASAGTRAKYLAEITAQGNEDWTTSPVENTFRPSGIPDINGDVRTMAGGYYTHTVIDDWPTDGADGLLLGKGAGGKAARLSVNFATSTFTAGLPERDQGPQGIHQAALRGAGSVTPTGRRKPRWCRARPASNPLSPICW